jgi:hypothetical protein
MTESVGMSGFQPVTVGPCPYNVQALNALVDSVRHGGQTITGAVASCPSVAHPGWVVEEAAHLNALAPSGTPAVELSGSRTHANSYSPPGDLCPFRTTPADAVTRKVVKNVQVVTLV